MAAEHVGHDHEPGDGHLIERSGFHDFGDVPFGEVVVHRFRLENTERTPLVIQNLDASCTCSIPRVSTTDPRTGETLLGDPTRSGQILTVPPGAEVTLDVSIDTRNVRVKNIDKLVSLRVTTDSLYQPFTTLEMHLIVTRPFDLYPSDSLDLGLVPVGTGRAGSLQLTQAGTSGALLTEVLETSHEALVATAVYDFGQARPLWQLDAALAPGFDLGAFHGWVRLGSKLPDGEPGPEMLVLVNGRVVEDLYVPQGRLILIGQPPAAWADVEAVDAEQRLVLEEPELRGDGAELFEVSAAPREPDDDGGSRTWRITLTLREGAELPAHSLTGMAVVKTRSPIEVEKEIPYVYVPR